MLKKVSFKDQVYEYIKQAIVMGDMKAGETYSEQMLADTLNVSRTPVREAVLQLKFENLVSVFNAKGFSVRPISFPEVQQIFQARIAIEGEALALLASQMDTEEARDVLARMESCVADDMEGHRDAGQRYEFMQADMEFHMLGVSYTGNEFFIHVMRMMRTRMEQAIVSSLAHSDRQFVAVQEHEAIIAALRAGDSEGARHALERHMRRTEEILRGMME